MKNGPDFSRVASLLGDPARANMLTALMGGKALTATELAGEAGVTAQTASSHLARLREGGLLRQRKQGRHKYFALASGEVAEAIEALMGLAVAGGHCRTRMGPRDCALRNARICYNHLAGRLGVSLFERLVAGGEIAIAADGLVLTPKGEEFACKLGVPVEELRSGRAELCRECLDWSERKSHLAGSLGRTLLSRFVELGWMKVDRATRVVTLLPRGQHEFSAILGNRAPV